VLDNPALILAEDYWSTLEAAEKRRVIDYLFAPGNKSTMLISTNDIETAKRCDKIILLSNGTIVAEGKYEEIKNHPDYKKLNEFLSL
jgi:ABC-type transport system involved in cytochrome bd biosynthesis fused ATPase/permease subunit